MRGHVDPQSGLFSYFSVEERIPADHPLRRLKAQVEPVLASMGAQFDGMYAAGGRPSIAPERLLKATLLIALYSVRSDRLFCEMLGYNMLFRWFLDVSIEVDDIESALKRVKKAGIPIEYGPESEPWGVRRFYVRDPFGKLINILQHE